MRKPLPLLFLLVSALLLLAADPRPFTPDPELLRPPTGAYVLTGGGKLPDAVADRFVEMAGGLKAKLVVLSTVADDGDKLLETWKGRKPASVELLHPKDRKAVDAAFAKPLTEASGVWVEGDAGDILKAYQGTAVEKELRKVLDRGGVVGGMAVTVLAGKQTAQGKAGFGWLPGIIGEAGEAEGKRVAGLQEVVAKTPGMVGLAIDQATAVVIRGRSVRVIGDGSAAVCLAAGNRRAASSVVLKANQQADLLAWQRSAIARAQPAFPADKPAVPEVPKGTLVIGGGGGTPQVIVKRFIELAGGEDALIVVVPTALGDTVPDTVGEVRMLTSAGAKNVKLLHTTDRLEADKSEFLAPFKDAKAVWFSGGRQWRFVDAYEGTRTEKFFHDVLARGGVIGGSSAGASIQSEYMPRGHPLGNTVMMAEGYERGFGFLPGVAVDQHFFARKREKDMAELVKAYPQLLGIGIDEGTYLVVEGSIAEVVGKSKAAFFDPKKAAKAGEKEYEEVPAGAKYDLKKRERVKE